MYPTNVDNVVAYARGIQGDPGELTQADIDALKGGVTGAGDTLAKLYALIQLRATIDGANLTNVTVPTQSAGNNSTKASSTAFVQQELFNALLNYATLAYVTALAEGMDPKASVKAATTANITLSGAQTIDGVALVATDRCLVKNQTTTSQNGIYNVASGAWTRALDFNSWSEIPAAHTFVEQGTVNAETAWVCIADQGGTLGTTAIPFTQYAGAGTYLPGIGLSLTGNTFAISDPELLAIAGLTSAADKMAYFTGAGTAALADFTAYGRSLAAAANAAAAKTLLAIVAADISDASANGRSLITAASYAAMRTLLGLVIGTDVQAQDAELQALAGLTSAANKIPYFTGSGTASLLTLTTDGTLAGNSDTNVASEKSVKTAIAQAVVGLFDDRGSYDASGNAFPSSGGSGTSGAILKGDIWLISVAGTLGGAGVEIGDQVRALVDTPGTTAANWAITQANIVNAVTTAAAQTLTNKDLNSGTNTFPTFNQNTTGSAAKLTTARNIDGQPFDGTAAITVVAPGTHAASSKVTPVDADEIPLVDSAASNVLAKLTWANLKATLKTYFDGLYPSLSTLTTRGDIFYRGASSVSRLALGTAGYFLKSDGTDLGYFFCREVLTANRTYYVRTDGSDSNTGLVNSAGGAFLTIQKAIDVCALTLDFGGFAVTISVAAGTYTGTVTIRAMVGLVGITSLAIVGAGATSIVSTTSNHCFTANGPTTMALIQNFKTVTTTGGNHYDLRGGAYLLVQPSELGACAGTAHLFCSGAGGKMTFQPQNFTISGGCAAGYWAYASQGGIITGTSIGTVTLTGTPAFVSFVEAENGTVRLGSNTWSGAATGKRYEAALNGIVDTSGQATTWLPGNAAGTTATQGQYV